MPVIYLISPEKMTLYYEKRLPSDDTDMICVVRSELVYGSGEKMHYIVPKRNIAYIEIRPERKPENKPQP